MLPLPFWIVDVFAEKKYAGNQLAIFTQAGNLSTEEMQQIAKEVNFSETTFILSPEMRSGGYDVRIFTPAKELPFAGHPTLGTAFVLQQGILQQAVEQIILNLKVGPIPVTLTYQNQVPEVLWMRQKPPEFGSILSAEAIAPVLSLNPNDIDPRFPIQEVSTGVPFIIVPLKNLAALQRIKVNGEQLARVVEPLQAKEIFAFCPETRDLANQFSARMFAPLLGIAEDPATGSANGCFAGYLVQHAYLGNGPLSVQVEQGYEMGRPSLLRLQAQKQDGAIAVSVGGKVIPVARGEFLD
jgi:trans-2,3-dihydro-3-hydroxyanthranilate isomerase